MGKSGARTSAMEACYLYVVARWYGSLDCEYDQLSFHWDSPRAAVWIWYVDQFRSHTHSSLKQDCALIRLLTSPVAL